jgi:signal transduction histidine kinase
MDANFSVDPALIARLGRELIARKEIAICELIKNSYDADAKKVEVFFRNTNSSGGSIAVIDNGNGMSQNDLVNNFMRLGTSNKVVNDISPVLKRRVSGQKGLGRIAAQRLGSTLNVISKKIDFSTVAVDIDWKAFYNSATIAEVKFDIYEPKQRTYQGTELTINELEDKWTKEDIKNIYPYFKTILDIKRTDEFEVNCFFEENGNQEQVTINEIDITPYHLAAIEYNIDETGKVNYEFTGGKSIKLNEKSSLEKLYPHLSGVTFQAYYFIFIPSYVPARLSKEVNEQADRYPGIKVYRKGVRVLPYGEPGDDWLGLDSSDSLRNYLFPHKNRNFLGAVKIEGESMNYLRESASREGLIVNTDFDDLAIITYDLIAACGQRIAEIRNRKSTRGPAKPKNPVKVLEIAAKDLSNLSKNISHEDKEVIKVKLAEISESINQTQSFVKDSVEEVSMLRVLASLGLSLGEFVHEMQHYLVQMESGLEKVEILLKGRNVLALVDLRNGINSFKSFLGYFSKVISKNIDRNIGPGLDIRFYVRDFINAIRNSLNENNIQLEGPYYLQNLLLPVPIHYSEWYSILFNFYTNSLKAIRKAQVVGKLKIEAGKVENSVFLRFEDNGTGISPESRDRLFDAFYTTYLQDSVQPSTGLGLYIVRQIVDSYGGDIGLAEPSTGYKTCIQVTFPVSTSNNK